VAPAGLNLHAAEWKTLKLCHWQCSTASCNGSTASSTAAAEAVSQWQTMLQTVECVNLIGPVGCLVLPCAALQRGDRVVVAFDIACGQCFFCNHGYQSSCDTTNPSKVRCCVSTTGWSQHC
jgi:D-arabinose 1-dehydrogenase-like Zn-dependent alcohol dehydrogenase